MKFVIRCMIPTEAGNKIVKDPKFIENVEGYIRKVKAEASYFFEAGGERVMVFIVDMPSTDMMPTVAEPLFQLGGKVEFHPVMLLDDLKKAIRNMA